MPLTDMLAILEVIDQITSPIANTLTILVVILQASGYGLGPFRRSQDKYRGPYLP